MNSKLLKNLLALLLTFLFNQSELAVMAQAGQAELTGEARITLTETRSNRSYSSTSASSGVYTLTSLRPGGGPRVVQMGLKLNF